MCELWPWPWTYDLVSRLWHPLGHGQQLCEIISKSNKAVRSYGPDTDFGYVCTVILTLEIWPKVQVMTHPWVIDNKCLKYCSNPSYQWKVMARTRIWLCVYWDIDLGDMTLGQGHDTPLGHGQQLSEVLFKSKLAEKVMARTRNLVMCILWPWSYDLGSRSWHNLGSLTTIVWNIIQIQQGSKKLWPGHGFCLCVHCDLDLGVMTSGQGRDTPFGHGQQLC